MQERQFSDDLVPHVPGADIRAYPDGGMTVPRTLDYVTCPRCGEQMPTGGVGGPFGRKPLSIDVKNIVDTLQRCRDIALAAKTLGCSRGYIYQELKKRGTTPREVLEKE